MGLVCLKCSNCAASLDIDEKSLGKYLFCSSCGSKYIYERDATTITEEDLLKRGVEHLKAPNFDRAHKYFDAFIDAKATDYKGYLGIYLTWLVESHKKIPYKLIQAMYSNTESSQIVNSQFDNKLPQEYAWLYNRYIMDPHECQFRWDKDSSATWNNLSRQAKKYYDEYESIYKQILNKAITWAPPQIKENLRLIALPELCKRIRDDQYESLLNERIADYTALIHSDYCATEFKRLTAIYNNSAEKRISEKRKKYQDTKSSDAKATVKSFFSSLFFGVILGIPMGWILYKWSGHAISSMPFVFNTNSKLRYVYFYVAMAALFFIAIFMYKRGKRVDRQYIKKLKVAVEKEEANYQAALADQKNKLGNFANEQNKVSAEIEHLKKEIYDNSTKASSDTILSYASLLKA